MTVAVLPYHKTEAASAFVLNEVLFITCYFLWIKFNRFGDFISKHKNVLLGMQPNVLSALEDYLLLLKVFISIDVLYAVAFDFDFFAFCRVRRAFLHQISKVYRLFFATLFVFLPVPQTNKTILNTFFEFVVFLRVYAAALFIRPTNSFCLNCLNSWFSPRNIRLIACMKKFVFFGCLSCSWTQIL